MADTSTEWQAEAVRLRREEKMETAEIAARVDRSASRVRRVLAEASAARFTDYALDDPPLPGQIDIDGNEAAFTKAGAENPPPLVPGLDDSEVQAVIDRDPLEDFKAEAGEAVGPMPPREMDGGVLVETELQLPGTRQIAFDLGPEMDVPSRGQIVIKSPQLPSGFYGMGDVVTGTFTARIVKVAGEEKEHKASGEFRARPQAHVALITEISFEAVGDGE